MAKPIEQQVAELTVEQKNSFKKITKNYYISTFAIILAGFMLFGGLFAFFSIRANVEKDKVEQIETQIQLNRMNGKLALDYYDDLYEAEDEYYDAMGMRAYAFFIGGGFILGAYLILYVILKKKYPYYSDKKYSYLKKTGYFNNPQ